MLPREKPLVYPVSLKAYQTLSAFMCVRVCEHTCMEPCLPCLLHAHAHMWDPCANALPPPLHMRTGRYAQVHAFLYRKGSIASSGDRLGRHALLLAFP
jgi:hypothetical protein